MSDLPSIYTARRTADGSGMDYANRELLKREAGAVHAAGGALHDRAWALLYLIEAHYWRAKQAVDAAPPAFRRRVHGARYSPEYELCIDVYTRHWLHANGVRLGRPDELAYLSNEFGYSPEANACLPTGASEYQIPL